MSKFLDVCHSITTKYNTPIWSKFLQGIRKYELVKPNDSIAVCLSGGKDSFLLAILFLMYKKYIDSSINVKIIFMNPGYDNDSYLKVVENIKRLELDVITFNSRIFEIVEGSKSPCYGCAKMRRGALYSKAYDEGCMKIALGHHYNDVLETTLMSILYTGKFECMLPKLKSTAHSGMELIRPLYLINEDDIISLWKYNELEFIKCACVVTKKASCDSGESKRKETKELIKKLKESNPFIEQNLFSSMSNVYIGKVLGYIDNGNNRVSFLDNYEDGEIDG